MTTGARAIATAVGIWLAAGSVETRGVQPRNGGTEDVTLEVTLSPTPGRMASGDRIVLTSSMDIDLDDVERLEDRLLFDRRGSAIERLRFEILGDLAPLLGANGAGRTTTMTLLISEIGAASGTPLGTATDVRLDASGRVSLTPDPEGSSRLLDLIIARRADRLTLASRIEIRMAERDAEDPDVRRRIVEAFEAGVMAEIVMRLRRQ